MFHGQPSSAVGPGASRLNKAEPVPLMPPPKGFTSPRKSGRDDKSWLNKASSPTSPIKGDIMKSIPSPLTQSPSFQSKKSTPSMDNDLKFDPGDFGNSNSPAKEKSKLGYFSEEEFDEVDWDNNNGSGDSSPRRARRAGQRRNNAPPATPKTPSSSGGADPSSKKLKIRMKVSANALAGMSNDADASPDKAKLVGEAMKKLKEKRGNKFKESPGEARRSYSMGANENARSAAAARNALGAGSDHISREKSESLGSSMGGYALAESLASSHGPSASRGRKSDKDRTRGRSRSRARSRSRHRTKPAAADQKLIDWCNDPDNENDWSDEEEAKKESTTKSPRGRRARAHLKVRRSSRGSGNEDGLKVPSMDVFNDDVEWPEAKVDFSDKEESEYIKQVLNEAKISDDQYQILKDAGLEIVLKKAQS